MPELKCPVCGDLLHREERTLRCRKGHCYDVARQGYVNLLMSNHSSSKRHGDDKAMVAARSAFLEQGYYDILRNAVCAAAVEHTGESAELLDAGCGEGFYTAAVKKTLEAAGKTCHACGVDISREALIACAKRQADITLAVASINHLPVPDSSCDLLMSIFAPDDAAEFHRALRPGGTLLRVVPLEDHLMGLKAAVYDRPYPNPPPQYAPEGFAPPKRTDVRDTILLSSNEDIRNLFLMTPYYYKTGRRDQQKLDSLATLETEISFGIFCYKRL